MIKQSQARGEDACAERERESHARPCRLARAPVRTRSALLCTPFPPLSHRADTVHARVRPPAGRAADRGQGGGSQRAATRGRARGRGGDAHAA
eukprot:2329630-Prymnesium_polylepis.1